MLHYTLAKLSSGEPEKVITYLTSGVGIITSPYVSGGNWWRLLWYHVIAFVCLTECCR
jgi:hypothetical protein